MIQNFPCARSLTTKIVIKLHHFFTKVMFSGELQVLFSAVPDMDLSEHGRIMSSQTS